MSSHRHRIDTLVTHITRHNRIGLPRTTQSPHRIRYQIAISSVYTTQSPYRHIGIGSLHITRSKHQHRIATYDTHITLHDCHINILQHRYRIAIRHDRHIGIELQHRHTTYTARLPHNTSPQDHIIGITSPHDTIVTRSPHRYRIATSPHDTIARRHGRHITSPHHNIGITSHHYTTRSPYTTQSPHRIRYRIATIARRHNHYIGIELARGTLATRHTQYNRHTRYNRHSIFSIRSPHDTHTTQHNRIGLPHTTQSPHRYTRHVHHIATSNRHVAISVSHCHIRYDRPLDTHTAIGIRDTIATAHSVSDRHIAVCIGSLHRHTHHTTRLLYDATRSAYNWIDTYDTIATQHNWTAI
jgi:hypothetical protein